jgi:hypothetical protein
MNTLVLAPQAPPLVIPWHPEDTTDTVHEYFIPRSLALYLLRVIRRYPGIDGMLMLGLHPRHHGLQVWYTDGTTKTFRTVEDVLHHWAMTCWHPHHRC